MAVTNRKFQDKLDIRFLYFQTPKEGSRLVEMSMLLSSGEYLEYNIRVNYPYGVSYHVYWQFRKIFAKYKLTRNSVVINQKGLRKTHPVRLIFRMLKQNMNFILEEVPTDLMLARISRWHESLLHR